MSEHFLGSGDTKERYINSSFMGLRKVNEELSNSSPNKCVDSTQTTAMSQRHSVLCEPIIRRLGRWETTSLGSDTQVEM